MTTLRNRVVGALAAAWIGVIGPATAGLHEALAQDAAQAPLEPLHSDPFDRILIVQARHEGLRLLTSDDQVLASGTPSADARS